MSDAEHWSRIRALRDKGELVRKFVYDHALKIEMTLDRMQDADTDEKKSEQLQMTYDSAKAIRAYMEELR